MARCVFCGSGGAKRACPALGGKICPRCCAEHQRREIPCPVGCPFLRQHAGHAFQTAMPKLIAYALEDEARATPAFLKLADPQRTLGAWEEPLALAYVAYGHADDKGERAVDAFLREHAAALRAGELEALAALRDTAWPSLFEVQQVRPDVGLELLDLATGEPVSVREKSATHHLAKYDLLLGWLVRLGDHYEITGAATGVPRPHREAVSRALMKELRRLRKSHPGSADRVLLRAVIPTVQQALRAAFENWRMPKIVTMDGEDLVFCEAVFDVDDRDAVLSRLGSHPDMDEDKEGFIWVDRNGRRQLGPGPLHLGSIRFEKGRLVLETKSRERLERGKTLIAELLSGVARHRVDSIKDLDVAMEEAASRPARAPSAEIPADIQAEVIAQLMQQHLASWVDMELPALRGKTPRQAVKTAAGRKQVLAMLKDQENSTLRQPGGDRIDFGVVYAELGLPP